VDSYSLSIHIGWKQLGGFGPRVDSNVGHFTFGLFSAFIMMSSILRLADFNGDDLWFDHIPLHKTVETLPKIYIIDTIGTNAVSSGQIFTLSQV